MYHLKFKLGSGKIFPILPIVAWFLVHLVWSSAVVSSLLRGSMYLCCNEWLCELNFSRSSFTTSAGLNELIYSHVTGWIDVVNDHLNTQCWAHQFTRTQVRMWKCSLKKRRSYIFSEKAAVSEFKVNYLSLPWSKSADLLHRVLTQTVNIKQQLLPSQLYLIHIKIVSLQSAINHVFIVCVSFINYLSKPFCIDLLYILQSASAQLLPMKCLSLATWRRLVTRL